MCRAFRIKGAVQGSRVGGFSDITSLLSSLPFHLLWLCQTRVLMFWLRVSNPLLSMRLGLDAPEPDGPLPNKLALRADAAVQIYMNT